MMRNVYFVLEDEAEAWFENRKAYLQSWDNFHQQVRDTSASTGRRDRARRLFEARIQKPTESVAMFAKDLIRLFRRIDPDMGEAGKLRHLVQGVNDQLLAGLVRSSLRP